METLGFTIVPLPREAYGLFHLFAKANEHYDVVGDFFGIIKPPVPDRPKVHLDLEVAEFKTVATNNVDIGIGLDFLKGFFSLFSAIPLVGDIGAAVTAGFKGSKNVELEYDNVLEDIVYPVDFAPTIDGYEWNGLPRFLRDPLRKGKCCVLLDYLKSDKLNLRAYNEKGTKVKAEASFFKDLFGVNAGVQVDATDEYTVTFAGKKALPIALKAFKVNMSDQDRFSLLGGTADVSRESGTEGETTDKFEAEKFSEERGPVKLEWRSDK